MPNTKIVATLGPASDGLPVLHKLLDAGVDVFRLNASHGPIELHVERIGKVRGLAAERGQEVAIFLDLQGPKIRLGRFEGGGCLLETGAEFTITVENVPGTCQRASTSYTSFAKDVRPGDRVLLADGAVELRAIESDGVEVRCEVVRGGPISDNKGINLPGARITSPSITSKDLADLEAGIEAGIDMVALSFVRTAQDVCELRTRLAGREIPIIAKIEKPQAWENIDSILDEADGVMVARGDLGVEMALEKVPPIQKSIIRRARLRGKFAITATQMLESMVENATPTRAEVSDVANAIYDGTDAVMLSAETSIGRFPVEAAEIMGRIAQEAEHSIRARGFREPPRNPSPTHAEIVADAAYRAAREAGVAAIVVFTASGSSARLISRFRPPVQIHAITPSHAVARRLAIQYAVNPICMPEVRSTDEMIALVDRLMVEKHAVSHGQSVVMVGGQPIGRPGTTNFMNLHRIGDLRDH
ncbi:MAG: pyruvate kinase [Bryobacteraceae bacterium]